MEPRTEPDVASSNEIADQLRRILSSELFLRSERLSSLLQFLINQSIEVPARKLKQFEIATRVLGRSQDFDPALDPIVRIQMGRLRSQLKLYYQSFASKDELVIHIPKGSYLPVYSYIEDTGESFRKQNEQDIYSLGISMIECPESSFDCRLIADGLTSELLLELSSYQHLQVIRMANPVDGSER
jgi:hypothetical protein